MKIIYIFLILLSFLNSSNISEEKIQQDFLKLAKHIGDIALIREATNFRFPLINNYEEEVIKEYGDFIIDVSKNNNMSESEYLSIFLKDVENTYFYEQFRVPTLSTKGIIVNREYMDVLYERFPQHKKIIKINFDTNSINLDPFHLEDNEVKLYHFKNIIVDDKVSAFVQIFNAYMLVLVVCSILSLIMILVFTEIKKHRIIKILFSSYFIVLFVVYLYILDYFFHFFHIYVDEYIGSFLIATGLLITFIYYVFNKKRETILINGIMIFAISGSIIGILNIIY